MIANLGQQLQVCLSGVCYEWVKHIPAALYHLLSNGAAERMLQSVKQDVKVTWNGHFRPFCSARTQPHASTGALLGLEPHTQLQLLRPVMREIKHNKSVSTNNPMHSPGLC